MRATAELAQALAARRGSALAPGSTLGRAVLLRLELRRAAGGARRDSCAVRRCGTLGGRDGGVDPLLRPARGALGALVARPLLPLGEGASALL